MRGLTSIQKGRRKDSKYQPTKHPTIRTTRTMWVISLAIINVLLGISQMGF